MSVNLKNTTSISIGALLSIGMRWIDRLIGFTSTLILARLLAPSDIGIIAMSSLVIGMIDILLDLGVNIVLIQNKDATSDHYNAGWSLRILQSLLAGLAIFIASFPAADYFQEPQVTQVLQVLAISPILAGLENIGIVSFQKNLQFGLEFRFFFIKRLVGFITTITAAWILQDFWALVIGSLMSRFIGMVVSYFVHPMRPKFTLKGINEILSFSTWILLRGIGNYLHTEVHRLVVGHRETAFVMGAYSLAGEISAIPTTELLAPLSRVLFPAFVRLKDDMVELKRSYLLALGIQTLVGIPAGVGVVLVANELVLSLLGEKWISAIPFIQIFGIFNIMGAINYSGGYLLLALNKAKQLAIFTWIQVILFCILVEFVFPDANALLIAQVRVAVGVISLLPNMIYLGYLLPTLKVLDRIACIWRPVFAAGIMSLAVYNLPIILNVPILGFLCIKIVVGVCVYSLSILVCWLIAARPDGAEQYLFNKLREFISAGSKKIQQKPV